jgi:hypothetical protein
MKLAAEAPGVSSEKPAKPPQTPSSSSATIVSSAAEMRGRERHFPRLCHVCEAPMAVQEDNCWHCGAVWGESHDAAPAKRVADHAVAA